MAREDLKNYLLNSDKNSLQKLINESNSKKDFLEKLFEKKLYMSGTLYRFFTALCKKYNLEETFLFPVGTLGGRMAGRKRFQTFEEYVNSDNVIVSSRLKSRLFADGIKERICEICGLEIWNDRPIPLELHHVDGNSQNLDISNLMIICPNCHAQTDNYKSKNKSKI